MKPQTGPWTILIPAPDRWLTANDRGRWDIARRVKTWRDAAFVAAFQVKPPKGLERVRVDVLWTFAGRSPVREIENLRPTLKAVIDGAVGPKGKTAPGYGIVVDDSDRHLVYGDYLSQVTAHDRRHPAGAVCCCGTVTITVSEVA
jgi:hypothetical protein